MLCTELGCTKSLGVINRNIYVDGTRKEKKFRETDLDIEFEGSPVFNGDDIGLVLRAYDRTGPSTEYARDG